MTEPELVEEIKNLASDSAHRATLWEHFHHVTKCGGDKAVSRAFPVKLRPVDLLVSARS